MKTLVKQLPVVSLILAFFLISFAAYADSNENSNEIFDPKKMRSGLIFDLDNILDSPLKFRLDIIQPEKHLVNISIYDEEGNQVYSAFTSKTQNNQLFNLTDLGYGEYTVEISTLGEVSSDKIKLERPEYLYPMGFIKESVVDKNKVTIVSLNAESPVTLEITDLNNQVVYSDLFFRKDLRENLNLNRLSEGEYIVTLKSKDFTETKTITVK